MRSGCTSQLGLWGCCGFTTAQLHFLVCSQFLSSSFPRPDSMIPFLAPYRADVFHDLSQEPGFLSPAVMANSEPSAQPAGSPTTACFSFCSTLGLAGTGAAAAPGQASSSLLPVYVQSQPGVTRGTQSTSPGLGPLSWHLPEPSPALPASLPGCQGTAWLCCASRDGDRAEGPTGFAGNSIQIPHYGKKGNHSVPGWPQTEQSQQGGAGSSHTRWCDTMEVSQEGWWH